MNYIHKEGYNTLLLSAGLLSGINFITRWFCPGCYTLHFSLGLISIAFFLLIASFFRNPKRKINNNSGQVISPCDGTVVAIETTIEKEYFKKERIQISIFMSPANVHVNRNPVAGKVEYVKYHPGKYLVAWHPKSSEENERNTVVINYGKDSILFRQIAGKVARKIVCYLKGGENVDAGSEMGFIKFGSRVDIFLPPDVKINIKLKDRVRGGETVLALL